MDTILLWVTIYVSWVISSFLVLVYFGSLDNIVVFGPGNSPAMIGSLKLDTWLRWSSIATYTFFNHAISGTSSNIIDPWIMNEVQDDSHKRLRFTRQKSLAIIVIYKITGWIDYILYLVIALSRLDLMIIGITADVIFQGRVFYCQIKKKSYTREDLITDVLIQN